VHRSLSEGVEGPSKSWQARYIPIADLPAEAFARLAERGEFTEPDDYVFCSRLGRPLDGSALRKRFKRAAAGAGLRALRFHALHHGAGSILARQADFRGSSPFSVTDG
jgi:site-specific recombinase XerC